MSVNIQMCIELQKRGKYHRAICYACRQMRKCIYFGKGYPMDKRKNEPGFMETVRMIRGQVK